jgi:hypothetical protein
LEAGAGVSLLFRNRRFRTLVMGSGGLGVRLPFGPWYAEALIRGGYPFIAEGTVSFGYTFTPKGGGR